VKTDWRIELPLMLMVAAMFAGAIAVWPIAPDQIPVHWNVQGNVDRYGGKFEGLVALPLLALGLYVAMRYLPRIDPGRANYARFLGAYAVIRASILVVMAAIYGAMLLWVLKWPIDMSTVIPIVVGALFVVFGGVLGKIRPNWFVGVRTPWTMSSKISWVRTHRPGGWLFVALGALVAVTGIFRIAAFAYVALGAMVGVVVTLVVYSYFAWRSDPDKQHPAGTQPADE
jgi:uncharacterized membrane protein